MRERREHSAIQITGKLEDEGEGERERPSILPEQRITNRAWQEKQKEKEQGKTLQHQRQREHSLSVAR